MAINEYSRAYEQYKREVRELLEEQAQRLRDAGGTVMGAHLRESRPAEEITRRADEFRQRFSEPVLIAPSPRPSG